MYDFIIFYRALGVNGIKNDTQNIASSLSAGYIVLIVLMLLIFFAFFALFSYSIKKRFFPSQIPSERVQLLELQNFGFENVNGPFVDVPLNVDEQSSLINENFREA